MYKYYLATFRSGGVVMYRIDPTNLVLGLHYLDFDTKNILDLMLEFNSNKDLIWHVSSYRNLEDLRFDVKSLTLIEMG